MCRTKRKVDEVTTHQDDSLMGVIQADAVAMNKGWKITLSLNHSQKEFKIDTGADVTVLPENEYLLKRDGPLTQVNERLSGASQQLWYDVRETAMEGQRNTTKRVHSA